MKSNNVIGRTLIGSNGAIGMRETGDGGGINIDGGGFEKDCLDMCTDGFLRLRVSLSKRWSWIFGNSSVFELVKGNDLVADSGDGVGGFNDVDCSLADMKRNWYWWTIKYKKRKQTKIYDSILIF